MAEKSICTFPFWQGVGVSKMSPLKYRSSKLVLCLHRLQLTSDLAFLKGKWAVNSCSCLWLTIFQPVMGLYSMGGEAMAPTVASWGTTKSSSLCLAGNSRARTLSCWGSAESLAPATHLRSLQVRALSGYCWVCIDSALFALIRRTI